MTSMLTASLRFDAASESSTGNGWNVIVADDVAQVPIISDIFYATITLAQAAIQDAFSADAATNNYFLSAAQGAILASSAAAVATELSNRRTADGLDATMP